jgi:hypothetical protein
VAQRNAAFSVCPHALAIGPTSAQRIAHGNGARAQFIVAGRSPQIDQTSYPAHRRRSASVRVRHSPVANVGLTGTEASTT